MPVSGRTLMRQACPKTSYIALWVTPWTECSEESLLAWVRTLSTTTRDVLFEPVLPANRLDALEESFEIGAGKGGKLEIDAIGGPERQIRAIGGGEFAKPAARGFLDRRQKDNAADGSGSVIPCGEQESGLFQFVRKDFFQPRWRTAPQISSYISIITVIQKM